VGNDSLAGSNYSYKVVAGFAAPICGSVEPDAFPFEPQIKEETLEFHHRVRSIRSLERRVPATFACDVAGIRIEMASALMASQPALGAFSEPKRFPELHSVRQVLHDWRVDHGLRTDADAPLRRPGLAVTAATLASDGSNLTAVFATLVHIRRETTALDEAIGRALPGARLMVPEPGKNASFGMVFPDHPRRVSEAPELSDGTLHYLLLVGALLALLLPAFIALNEPESSLHPMLLEPLAELVVAAARRTQVWLVTHAEILTQAITRLSGVVPRLVIKPDGETWVEGLKTIGE
jgi:predicted ATPase